MGNIGCLGEHTNNGKEAPQENMILLLCFYSQSTLVLHITVASFPDSETNEREESGLFYKK